MFQYVQADHRAAEAEKSLVDVVTSLVAYAQSAKLVKPTHGPLDHPAHLSQSTTVLRVTLRDDRHNPTRQQLPAVQLGATPDRRRDDPACAADGRPCRGSAESHPPGAAVASRRAGWRR